MKENSKVIKEWWEDHEAFIWWKDLSPKKRHDKMYFWCMSRNKSAFDFTIHDIIAIFQFWKIKNENKILSK